jgi:head-tail adaptor
VTQRRVSAAARKGSSVQDIAAKEKMSESEVRLRLQLAGDTAAREKAHATVR